MITWMRIHVYKAQDAEHKGPTGQKKKDSTTKWFTVF